MPTQAEPVTVLLADTKTGTGSNSAGAQVTQPPFDSNVPVIATASGEARYQGAVGGVGIAVSIDTGRDDHVRDDSFEGRSINMIHYASVSRAFMLPRGTPLVVNGRTDAHGLQHRPISGRRLASRWSSSPPTERGVQSSAGLLCSWM